MLSQELTNIKSVPRRNVKNVYGNATWRKGNILEMEARDTWENNREKRLYGATSYTNVNLSMPYVEPNPYVLKQRLVHENNVYDIITKQLAKVNYIHRYSYFDPVLQGPAPRKVPYSSGQQYSLNLMN
jgi:hypothetical protein